MFTNLFATRDQQHRDALIAKVGLLEAKAAALEADVRAYKLQYEAMTKSWKQAKADAAYWKFDGSRPQINVVSPLAAEPTQRPSTTTDALVLDLRKRVEDLESEAKRWVCCWPRKATN